MACCAQLGPDEPPALRATRLLLRRRLRFDLLFSLFVSLRGAALDIGPACLSLLAPILYALSTSLGVLRLVGWSGHELGFGRVDNEDVLSVDDFGSHGTERH